jgi:hypothetical protein
LVGSVILDHSGEGGYQADKTVEDLEKKRPKRQRQWGPVQRMDRPRRHVEDGMTML